MREQDKSACRSLHWRRHQGVTGLAYDSVMRHFNGERAQKRAISGGTLAAPGDSDG